jgi:hypothetical protein
MAAVEFVSLGQCLQDGKSYAVLASAIEQHGIYTWDRFGRFGHFKPGSAEADDVLDVLALQYAAEQSPYDDDDEDFDSPDSLLRLCGWPRDKLPDFAPFEAEMAGSPKRPGNAKEELNNLMIVGGLLACILGELAVSKHPDFASQADLVRHLVDKMKGCRGMSQRNLQDKFAAARRLVSEA